MSSETMSCEHPSNRPIYAGLLQRCEECDLVATAQQPNLDYTQSYFASDDAAGYDFSSDFARDLDADRFGIELDHLANLGHSGSLLDIGCATGSYLEHAAARGWDISGVEVSPFARQQASERLGIPVRSSLDELEPNQTFDVVTLHHVLEHVDEPCSFLRDKVAPRVENLLLIEVPNFDSLASYECGPAWRHLRPDQHVHHFTQATLTRTLQQAGFEVIRSYTLWEALWSVRAALFMLKLLPGLVRQPRDDWDLGPAERDGAADVSSYRSPQGLRRAAALASRWLCLPLIRHLERRGLGERVVVEARRPRAS